MTRCRGHGGGGRRPPVGKTGWRVGRTGRQSEPMTNGDAQAQRTNAGIEDGPGEGRAGAVGSGWRWWAAWLAVLGLALALRAPRLGERPMHADESVHAIKFIGLLEEGRYAYDPNEFHGPTLYYFTLPIAWLAGEKTGAELREATLRLTPLIFGLAVIALLPVAVGGRGRGASLAAGAWLAVSPVWAYYSRYFIHEMILVAATWWWLVCLWRLWRTGRWRWAAAAGLGLGLMHATKETFVFNVAAAAGAAAVAWLWQRRRRPEWFSGRRAAGLGVVMAGVALVVSVTFFSSFFTHEGGWWQGPLDSVRTYAAWGARAKGESPHIHPWWFYLERLFWWRRPEGPLFTELAVGLLALVGLAAAVRGRLPAGVNAGWARFLALYTLLLAGMYTVIAYKTPWLVLVWYHGMVLLAGLGTVVLWRSGRRWWARGLAAAVFGAVGLHLAAQSCRAAFTYAAEPQNPWVYAHTSRDLLRLVKRVQGVARHHPHPEAMVVKVIAPGGDYWPLPWYLRTLPHVGYYAAVPEDPFADVVIAGSRIAPPLDDLSDKKWIMAGYYKLRPRVFLALYPRFDLWKAYVEAEPPTDDEEE
ncbi:MAG: TIGR03663 family protein [Verrucomicrobia bacterium]|nr:MAG: TIGR03663 family protein [Verrucomicrobiota bacterium]